MSFVCVFSECFLFLCVIVCFITVQLQWAQVSDQNAEAPLRQRSSEDHHEVQGPTSVLRQGQ